jgi:hypothetical protein
MVQGTASNKPNQKRSYKQLENEGNWQQKKQN